MASIIEMPKLSDTMTEGVVAKWLVKEGDTVKPGMSLLTIETDKATMEFEAPSGGKVLKILVQNGERCALQAPIAVLGKEGEDWQAALDAKVAKKVSSVSKPAASQSHNVLPSTGSKKRPQILALPKLSDTMTEGVIVRWLKQEGDVIKAGMPLLEIETDKASMEFESPYQGILLKVLVQAGDRKPLNSPIAVIGEAGADWESILAEQGQKQDHVPPKKTHSVEIKKEISFSPKMEDHKIRVSPLARKIAKDRGINLTDVAGSGPMGRIIKRDLNSFASGSVRSRQERISTLPLTNMRKVIATRLSSSMQTAPHFYLTLSVDMRSMLEGRKKLNERLQNEERLSVNDLIIFSTARALAKHPLVNGSWKEDHIDLHHHVHVAFAVALESGLVTPVVKFAHELSLKEIGFETKRLISLAKTQKLQPADYQSGTFTISNLGMSGIEEFTAVINPPQAAILAVGATIPTPVVNAKGQVVVEDRMKLTLSCDHRVVDGAVGAAFLAELKEIMENPICLFLS